MAGERDGPHFPDASVPAYGALDICPIEPLGGNGVSVAMDGSVNIAKGGRFIFAARAPATAREWTLEWKSEGRIRIRAIQLGSAETLQLSDTILWDDVNDAVPAGFAHRRCCITPWVMRFNSDIKWPLTYPTTSGLFFFDISPVGNEPARFGEMSLLCQKMQSPRPFIHAAGVTDFPMSGKIGAVDIVHVAGYQAADSSDTLAGWMYVYSDDTTALGFSTLRWNCGVAKERAMETSIAPDSTWFGPPGFAWGQALYSASDKHGTHWTAQYLWRFVNPYPEKTVRCLQMFRMLGDKRDYSVSFINSISAKDCVIALVEPEKTVLETDEDVEVTIYEWRADGKGVAVERMPIFAVKDEGKSTIVGQATMRRAKGWGASVARVRLCRDVCPGSVTLRCGKARSSRLSLMPPKSAGEKPFHYTMICGGMEPMRDFDRMRRSGYDEAKIHIPWKTRPDGSFDLGEWDWHVKKIDRAGMAVSIRNTFALPSAFTNQVEILKGWRDGATQPVRFRENDISNPFYRERLTAFYALMGRFAAGHPSIKGINANYGQRAPIAVVGGQPTLVWTNSRLARFREWRKVHGRSHENISLDTILNDRGILADYARCNEEDQDRLLEDICAAIRKNASGLHLAFNVNYHPVEDKLLGQSFAAYLKCGMKYAPASLFHETSERYSLSFAKWLSAARTCGLPYGDECFQNPPSYEHAALAYMWMGMMQCFEANYCQWWGGRPAIENVAQFKAYHRMLKDAEYLCDPVCLALSLETGFAEIEETLRASLHSRTLCHYALAHFLRELNINVDRYMIDVFPEKDSCVTSRLLIDDNTRAISREFGDRIERFIRRGGVFVASSLTDSLNGHAFLKRFGVDLPHQLARVKSSDPFPFYEVDAGTGKVVVLLKTWTYGWDPGRPDSERKKALALLTRLGAFEPLVSSSHPCVFATPYRAKDGAGLVSLINITCEDRIVSIGLSKRFGGRIKPIVYDMGTGKRLDVFSNDGYWHVAVSVGKINTTILRIN